MKMTFEEICKVDPLILSIYQEAKADKNCYRDDPNFCRYQLWHGLPRERGYVGLKFFIDQRADAWRKDERFAQLRTQQVYETVYWTILATIPACRHSKEESCPSDFPVPDIDPETAKEVAAGRPRDSGTYDVIEMLQHAGDPTSQASQPLLAHPPAKDEIEPIFVVNSEDDWWLLWYMLEFPERLKAGKINRLYAREAFYLLDNEAREVLLNSDLTKKEMTGQLSWRPVVLTFKDDEIERKLAQLCKQVTSVVPKRGKDGEPVTLTLEEVHRALKPLAPEIKFGIPDMPKEVLDGWLGEVCRTRMGKFPIAYAWPALLTAASVLVPRESGIRANLYCALVGGKGTGKSSAFDKAFKLFDLQRPPLLALKAGSAEGLAKLIGDVEGAPRLFYTDELAHLLLKAGIENASFPQFLSTAYYEDRGGLTIVRGAFIDFNCRLTLAGGVVEDAFGDLFGAATMQGFYDRFIFGQCPTDVEYLWEPFDGPTLEIEGRPVFVNVDASLWQERNRWKNELGIPGRVSEHALRVATIAASFDGRGTLRAEDLGPALAFAEYQMRVRKVLAPNPGKNSEAILAFQTMTWLRTHASNGEWVNRRKMLQACDAYRFGPNVTERTLKALELNGEIEQAKMGRQLVLRLNLDRL